MKLKGQVRNGVVVIEADSGLDEGAEVWITPASEPVGHPANVALVEAIRGLPPMSPEQSADWQRAMADVMAAREEDLALEEASDRDRAAYGDEEPTR